MNRTATQWRFSLIFLWTLSGLAFGHATQTPAAPQAGIFEDPEGRFTVPIPTNWTVEEGVGFITLADPSGELLTHLVVVESGDPEAAVAQAWRQVDPDFALEPSDVQEPPSEGGVERTIVVEYEGDDPIRFAEARLYEGQVYVTLVEGDLTVVQQRSAQLAIVGTGFQISALEVADLTGTEPRPVDGALTAELGSFVEDALPRFGIPGASVAVVQGGEVVYTDGFGVREAGGDAPMTPDTHMLIGSTGKSLTTLLMGTLVDEGLMDWDTPAVKVLPEFAVADAELTQTITLRNLVCACTGVPRRDLELFFNADELSAEGIVASLRTFEFFTDFGEAFQYSNQIVATGGYAAAAADGAAYGELFAGYEDSLKARVLDPIGMTNTTLSFEEVETAGDAATPHTLAFNGDYEPIPLAIERTLLPIGPAGSHWSTAEDMARYLQTELALGVSPDGTRVVSEANLRTTWEPQVPVTADMDYGLGWFVEDYRRLELIHHGGNTLGFTADLAFLPQKELGIVVLTNGQGTNAFNVAVRERLFELVFDQEQQVAAQIDFALEQTKVALAEVEETLREVQPSVVEPFVGSYQNDALGEVTLSLQGDTLTLDAGEFASELRPVVDNAGEPDGYIVYTAPLAGFPVRLQRESGQPVLELGEGAVTYTFTQVD